MQIKQIFLLIVIAFSLNSCINSIDGNGEVTKEERKVDSFNKIDISGGYEVLINQGDKERLELEVDKNLLEYIETNTKNNTLFISSKKPIGNATSLKLYISVVDVDDIDVSGAIELKNKGTCKTANLAIDISGVADVDLDVDVENLVMDMSGASETTLSGNANNFEIEISGSGELQAKKLKTRNTTIDISGAGSVKYKGNPKIEKDISGAGSIEKL